MSQPSQPHNWQGRRVHLGGASQASGRTTTVGGTLGTGGEGTVYADASRPDYVLKIMHRPTATSDAKTQAMLASPPAAQVGFYQGADLVQIAWPQERLTDDHGSYVGFSMRFLDVSRTIGLAAWINPRERRLNNLSQDDRLRIHLAANLASVTDYVNQAGHALVDLKPLNVLAYRTDGYLCLVDCDGFRVQHGSSLFPAGAYTPMYLAPEYQGVVVSADQLGEEQDRFALAVVIYELLDNGVHPFSGVDTMISSSISLVVDPLLDRIQRQRTFLDATSGMRAPGMSHHQFFADETVELFVRAFTGPGDQRPSAAEWKQHLQDLAQSGIRMCGTNPDHWHYGKGCPWCAGRMQMPPPQQQRAPASASSASRRFQVAPPVRGAAGSASASSARPSASPGGGARPTSASWSTPASSAVAGSVTVRTGAPGPSGGASVVKWAIGNSKRAMSAAAVLVLVGSGVWAVTRPSVDVLAPRRVHLDQVVKTESGLAEMVSQLQKNTGDRSADQFEQAVQQIAAMIQSARAAIESRDTERADALLARAEGSMQTLSQQIVAFVSRPAPPPPERARTDSTAPTDTTPTPKTENVWTDPPDDPFGGDGGFIKPASPPAATQPPRKIENVWDDPPDDPFGGDGGFIRPAAPAAR